MKIDELKKFILNKLSAELSPDLTYHGVQHTLAVLNACEQYIKRMQLTKHDAYLLRTAALLHDTGFLNTYENHEDESIRIAREILPDWNYSSEEIEKICNIIRSTKIPHKSGTILEQIIGDSDLDYLGTNAFWKTSEKLYNELLAYKKISSKKEWILLQIGFLQNHNYHTPFAQKYREPLKQKHLHELIDISNNNDK